MSLAEILGEHAAKATIGALVAGFFAGAVMVLRRGATNAHALDLLQREIAHRDEIRKLDRKSAEDRFRALEGRIEANEAKIDGARDAIMAKLNSMEMQQ